MTQWRMQDFSGRGVMPTLEGYLATFPQKIHENIESIPVGCVPPTFMAVGGGVLWSQGVYDPRGYDCQGLTKSVKFQRKDQSVERNAYFYYFGQFRVFPLYFW